ncbi:thioredoxin [Rhizobium sp. Leaf384]|uniref:thioredoxin n=1 Tax=unclassified Rhizobium TaxID=2613769 RepID=UPI000715A597|nr:MULTISPECIES: thioredoxin [unclassified Rhizobium]KQS76251.1 thioredoxin [Rhizobium sp. Leaf384]KQS78480.1 thioredoxin [Rhizobium sp. Leaf383]
MSGNNPYSGSYGSQMSATATYGGAPTGASASPVPSSPAAPAAGHALISDTTTATFARDVLEASRDLPVLVDFWAPWCGPCKQLTPIIEKVVTEAGGRVKLVKMNIDDHPSIAGQLGIQSIPAVVAFIGGRPADGFMGAVPESQIRAFIEKIAGPMVDDQAAEIEAALAEARQLLEAGDLQNAGGIFASVLQVDPEHLLARAGLAEVMMASDAIDQAREILSELSDEQKADPSVSPLLKRLDQIDEARKLGDPKALEAALVADPDDHAARLNLAKIRNVEGDRQAAADHLLAIMRRDRTFDDDGARRALVAFFEVWGPADPATLSARRKMSAILFS